MGKGKQSITGKREIYNKLITAGSRRRNPGVEGPGQMAALLDEYIDRRGQGEKLSIRAFCGQNKVPQKRFESLLRQTGAEPTATEAVPEAVDSYYSRADVQKALYLWAKGRRLALHYASGVIGLGFRKPEDVPLLAATSRTKSPTFHSSVGRYDGSQLIAFDLVCEVDFKGDWKTCFRTTRPLIHSLHGSGITFLVKYSGHSSAHVIVPCKGNDYGKAAAAFLSRLPSSIRGCDRLDLSFRQPQHYLRMPYAIHERTGLVSLPLTMEEFDGFDPDMAKPERVVIDTDRLERVLSADNGPWILGETKSR